MIIQIQMGQAIIILDLLEITHHFLIEVVALNSVPLEPHKGVVIMLQAEADQWVGLAVDQVADLEEAQVADLEVVAR